MGGIQRLLETSNPVGEVFWGSSYNFELRKDSVGKYYIKAYFKSGKYENSPIKPIKMGGID